MSIQTIYRGIEYRSRLEARWAAFFDHIGWEHTYEPFDGDGYIPDFLIHGDFPLIIEVKPAQSLADYQAATDKADRGLWNVWPDDRVLVVGVSPLPVFAGPHDAPPAGLLRESDGTWGLGLWHNGSDPVGVCHEYQSYACSPTNYYDGNPSGDAWLNRRMIEDLHSAWATAINDVKWRGRDSA